MSSIYKKGRDGYFYYQAYVFNPITKKKDKKVYHSLGTKDREEALIKQRQIDINYNNINHKKEKIRYHRRVITFSSLFFFLIFMIKIGFFSDGKVKPEITPIYQNEKQTYLNKNIDVKSNHISQIKEKISPYKTKKETIEETILPNYTIQRNTGSANSFKQGKIYITVDESASERQLKLLCDKIKKNNPQYENLLICMYKDNDLGIKIAKGIHPKNNKKDLESVWLVLYSYNLVEGVYFDSNPGMFLGNS